MPYLHTSISKLLLVGGVLCLIRPIAAGSIEDFDDMDNYHHKFKDHRDTKADKRLAVDLGKDDLNFTPPDANEIAKLKKMVAEINEVMSHKDNWTSCYEFVDGVTLNIKKLIDIDWQLYINFITYYFGGYGTIIRFKIPTSNVINRFQSSMRNDSVKWEEAELLLETSFDLNILLIRTNVSGIYAAYFELNIEGTTDMAYQGLMALKILDSGYLGVMDCREKFLAGFAPQDLFPSTPEEAMETVPQFKYKSENIIRLHLSPPPKDFFKASIYRGPDTRIPKTYDYGKVDSPKSLTIF